MGVKIDEFPRFVDHEFPTFDEFLEEVGMTARVNRRVELMTIARSISAEIEAQGISKTDLAARIGTSRAQLNRILDPHGRNLTMNSLARTAEALGMRIKLELVRKAA
jgi:antitoxin HicB